ncbi:alpha/beta fold hydrolase [Alicyclobacillus fodiniaquatilis]|uniref:Alpha/beta fold hydrolase n=1 Tax=Alicyclobacillus fodiniaquatilis TaxID=1661150 RepID=A0ABW4JDJ7_9BACL
MQSKKIYYEIYGEENLPTFLYLHGGPGIGSYDFNFIQGERLSRYIHLISIDQRGCLRSDAIDDEEDFSIQDLVADCEEIRQHFGIK